MNLRKIKAGSAAGRTSKRVSLVEKGDLASENLLTVETYNFMLRATRCGHCLFLYLFNFEVKYWIPYKLTHIAPKIFGMIVSILQGRVPRPPK